MAETNKQILIISSCHEDWGGSEELWARTIPYFQLAGYGITVFKIRLNTQHKKYVELAKQGVVLENLESEFGLLNSIKKPSLLLTKVFKRVLKMVKPDNTPYASDNYWVKKKLEKINPQFAIISQGINFDGLSLAYACLQLNIPYVLIAQKAVDFYWPTPFERPVMRKVYQQASWSYFVSKHNKQLTEEQFGIRLPKSEVIYNPVKVKRHITPMPSTEDGYKLACIGRYFLLDKGQDILIRIMAQAKWRERPITVSFIGSGTDKEALVEMIALLGVNNVRFLDHVDDIAKLWETYHALILPSRSEGLPLVLLEAMAVGRTAIISAAGGNAEVIIDGVNGFIGQANEVDFDNAMERAWNKREEWGAMGKLAHAFINENVPLQPEKDLVNSILNRMGK
jgi:glycosyltransferase involved in cell wall biosynthesis